MKSISKVAASFILVLGASSYGKAQAAPTGHNFIDDGSVSAPLDPARMTASEGSDSDAVAPGSQAAPGPQTPPPTPQTENANSSNDDQNDGQVNSKNFYAAIRQVDVEGRRAVAQGGWEVTKLQPGTRLVVNHEGHNCFLTVTSVTGNMVQLDGRHCEFMSQLRVGEHLEPSLFDEPKAPIVPFHHERFSVISPEEDNRLRFAVSLYYGFGNSLDSYNLNYNQGVAGSSGGTGSLVMSSAPGVAVEVYQAPENGIGWSGGVSYDFQRNVTGLNAYANGSYIGGTFNSPTPTLSLITVYGNFIFRAEKFYFPVGLNYTFPSFVGGANSFGNTTLVGGLGLQIAAGYTINDYLAAELWIQNLSLDGNTVTSQGTITYNGLNFTNTQLRLRFSF